MVVVIVSEIRHRPTANVIATTGTHQMAGCCWRMIHTTPLDITTAAAIRITDGHNKTQPQCGHLLRTVRSSAVICILYFWDCD